MVALAEQPTNTLVVAGIQGQDLLDESSGFLVVPLLGVQEGQVVEAAHVGAILEVAPLHQPPVAY